MEMGKKNKGKIRACVVWKTLKMYKLNKKKIGNFL